VPLDRLARRLQQLAGLRELLDSRDPEGIVAGYAAVLEVNAAITPAMVDRLLAHRCVWRGRVRVCMCMCMCARGRGVVWALQAGCAVVVAAAHTLGRTHAAPKPTPNNTPSVRPGLSKVQLAEIGVQARELFSKAARAAAAAAGGGAYGYVLPPKGGAAPAAAAARQQNAPDDGSGGGSKGGWKFWKGGGSGSTSASPSKPS
jgi:hypothetical protein